MLLYKNGVLFLTTSTEAECRRLNAEGRKKSNYFENTQRYKPRTDALCGHGRAIFSEHRIGNIYWNKTGQMVQFFFSFAGVVAAAFYHYRPDHQNY